MTQISIKDIILNSDSFTRPTLDTAKTQTEAFEILSTTVDNETKHLKVNQKLSPVSDQRSTQDDIIYEDLDATPKGSNSIGNRQWVSQI